MTKAEQAEIGVFLPIGNGGWIMSRNTSLHMEHIYDYNLKAAQIADRTGLDFIMSMAKWRGYGGETNHWSQTLESLTMMCGLAQATERVGVWATVHTTANHPLVISKMLVTLDQISHGRAGMNIVVGSRKPELEQLDLWGPQTLEAAARYHFTDEWLSVIEGVWENASFTHDGEYFHLEDTQLRPAPSVKPRLICAGISDAGLAFTTSRCDGAFVSAPNFSGLREVSDRVHELAAAQGRTIKTYTMSTIVIADSDAAAEAEVARIQDGIDQEAVDVINAAYRRNTDRADVLAIADANEQRRGFQTDVISGSSETVAEKIEAMLDATDVDGIMFTFADYHDGLEQFGTEVLGRIRATKVTAGA